MNVVSVDGTRSAEPLADTHVGFSDLAFQGNGERVSVIDIVTHVKVIQKGLGFSGGPDFCAAIRVLELEAVIIRDEAQIVEAHVGAR